MKFIVIDYDNVFENHGNFNLDKLYEIVKVSGYRFFTFNGRVFFYNKEDNSFHELPEAKIIYDEENN